MLQRKKSRDVVARLHRTETFDRPLRTWTDIRQRGRFHLQVQNPQEDPVFLPFVHNFFLLEEVEPPSIKRF